MVRERKREIGRVNTLPVEHKYVMHVRRRRERGRKGVCVLERERQRARVCVCMCVTNYKP